ncbi:MAG: XdhC/CoxI family protein [Caldilineaceae bacterium]
MSSIYAQLAQAIASDELVAVATVLSGPRTGQKILVRADGSIAGSLGDAALDAEVIERTQQAMQRQQCDRFTLSTPTEASPGELFVDVHVPPPTLIIVGAVHIAIPLVTFAKTLGFRTIVLDARTAFATQERFAHADELVIGWPADRMAERRLNETTYVVTLTHDDKLDNPALVVALNHPVRYVGALGSRRTHAKRVAALKEDGLTDAQIARIHAPIGLDLGGRSPEEIALAILAEIVTVKNGEAKRR